jgi:hypothetical protein
MRGQTEKAEAFVALHAQPGAFVIARRADDRLREAIQNAAR